ncbi:uncharacterized protein traf3ip2l [Thalassophryne amazonica]|uniref:uncharacterized protein traf3ip2l n=1 Tax=Thalassophryne amazonica TaxID=390379 RepID=UPI001472369D|nr:uncharacterized protein traf3ip2l [Thalassophryne amazonica]XP_034036485.1 uncharacterized protein traf3ip2l [Thalassophryne amazonica]
MFCGRSLTMLPTSLPSVSAPNSHLRRYLSARYNTPEEDDETMSTAERQAKALHKLDSASHSERRQRPAEHGAFVDPVMSRLDPGQDGHAEFDSLPGCCPYSAPRSLPAGFSQPTPFPSLEDGHRLHPSFASSWSGYPNSLPSCLSQNSDFSSESCKYKFLSLGHSSSLEQPLSLHSSPPSADLWRHTLSLYSYSPQGVSCCAQCPADAYSIGLVANKHLRPPYHPQHRLLYPADCRLPRDTFTHSGHRAEAKQKHPVYSSLLSLEQRRVFVTYEADNDQHVKEIINFVALLRHNGFDTHIDIFEQQFRSISKIDFMERYLSEKEYLIIIIISPKYYDTVTASPVDLENDERTFNTVYIHKQLQNEFIQNGSKNFRFIPILFPGAKKCHVPNWLQNTHVFEWPRDRDDILRRLMRVEKYNLPPIGELPTIVSIPL